MNELCQLSALEMAQKISLKEITPLELIDAHIAQIEKVNPQLNALVQLNFDEARKEAKEKRLPKKGETPRFFGVPCTIKDNIAVKGFSYSAGLISRKNIIAEKDAEVVSRMRQAGFIILGISNVPEALLWYDTENKLYGRTHNPWDLTRTPGGSSGGESAIISAAASPLGMGGDIGGSIRNPANFCGIVGHKPSGGMIPETGVWGAVAEKTLLKQFKVAGPLSRSVADIEALMPLIAYDDGVDANTFQRAYPKAQDFDPKEITVYWYDDNKIVSPDGEVRRALFDAINMLQEQGFKVEEWQPPDIEHSFALYVAALKSAGHFSYESRLSDGKGLSFWKSWFEYILGISAHTFPSMALYSYEKMMSLRSKDYEEMNAKRKGLQYIIERKLGSRGVLLSPSWPSVAPKIGKDVLQSFYGFTYCALYNILEMPATVLPVRQSTLGMPIGVQLAAIADHDPLCLYVASKLEQARGRFAFPALAH